MPPILHANSILGNEKSIRLRLTIRNRGSVICSTALPASKCVNFFALVKSLDRPMIDIVHGLLHRDAIVSVHAEHGTNAAFGASFHGCQPNRFLILQVLQSPLDDHQCMALFPCDAASADFDLDHSRCEHRVSIGTLPGRLE